MTQAHIARLSIGADAEAEVAGVLRTLMRQPWLVAVRDDEALAIARRNLAGLRSVFSRLGWTLVAERDLVRLVKSPPPRLADWSAQAPSPLACCWVFLLAAAAEGLPDQVTIGQLVEAGKAAAAEAPVGVRGDRAEHRAIVAAVRELVIRGIVEKTDGQLESFLDSDDALVLLTIFHTRMLHLVGNYDATTDPGEEPERWLRNVAREPDAARRMRRRLIEDTCASIPSTWTKPSRTGCPAGSGATTADRWPPRSALSSSGAPSASPAAPPPGGVDGLASASCRTRRSGVPADHRTRRLAGRTGSRSHRSALRRREPARGRGTTAGDRRLVVAFPGDGTVGVPAQLSLRAEPRPCPAFCRGPVHPRPCAVLTVLF